MKWSETKKGTGNIGTDVNFTVESTESGVRSVTFEVAGHPCLMVGIARYSDLGVYVPAPPKMVKRYALTGKLLGLTEINEIFEHEHEATSRLHEFESASGYPEKERFGLSISVVTVEESES